MAGPQMTETKKLIVAMKPVEIHYKAAAKALKMRFYSVAKFLKTIDQPEGFPNVKALAIWVDGVLWCGGDQHARNALLDRIDSKAARIIDQTVKDVRRPMHATKGATVSQSDAYMEELEEEIALPELDDEPAGVDDILN